MCGLAASSSSCWRVCASAAAMASTIRRSLVVFLVLSALFVSAYATADPEHAKGSAAEAQAKTQEGAAAAGESAKSWAELAKEKLNVFGSEAQDKAAEGADAAQGHAKSYLDLAKEKLHITGDKTAETAGAAKDTAADTAAQTKQKTYDTAGAAKDKAAEGADAAQGHAKSYLELAKEKLNVFSKYVFKSAPDPTLFVC